MADRTFFADFFWEVPKDGYHWISKRPTEEEDHGRWLTDGLPLHLRWPGRQYNLADTPALFRTFADIDPTEEGVIRFANQFGALGIVRSAAEGPQPLFIKRTALGDAHPEHPRFEGDNIVVLGELFDDWVHEIARMRFAVNLWDALRHQDTGALRALVEVDSADGRLYFTGRVAGGDGVGDYHVKMDLSADPAEAAMFRREVLDENQPAPIASAMILLQELVDEHMAHGVAPRLAVRSKAGVSELKLELLPRTLRGALWLQFARAVDRNVEVRTCEACGSWFEVSLEANRRDAKYCRPACRSRAYRQRQGSK